MNQSTRDIPQFTDTRENDRNLERLGDFEESRCQPVPNEVKQDIQNTLQHTFPEGKGS